MPLPQNPPVIVFPDAPQFPEFRDLPPWETLPPAVTLIIVVALVGCAVMLLGPLVRAFARRIERGPGGAVDGEVAQLRARLAALEADVQGVERGGAEQELYQLEERVEFLERLIARGEGGGR